MITLQDAFNTIWHKYLVERAKPGYDYGKRRCCYEAPDGSRCGYGWVMHNAGIDVDELFGCIERLIQFTPVVIPHFDAREAHAHNNLQECHDSAANRQGSFSNIQMVERINENYPDGYIQKDFYTDLRVYLTAFADIYDLTIPGG